MPLIVLYAIECDRCGLRVCEDSQRARAKFYARRSGAKEIVKGWLCHLCRLKDEEEANDERKAR